MRIWLLLGLLALPACGAYRAPIIYPEPQKIIWYANEVAVGINTIQHVGIELNKIVVCEAGSASSVDPGSPVLPQVCHPLLSEANTRAVGETATDIRAALRETPNGYVAIVSAGLDRLIQRLDNAGQVKLLPYIQAVRYLLTSVGP